MVDRQSEKLLRFLRASLKGWQTAVGDPTGTIETIMKYVQVKDRKIQTAMFEAMLPLVHTGEDMIGWMRPKDWHDMHQMLAEQGLIDNPKDQVSQLFTMQFLDRIKQEELK